MSAEILSGGKTKFQNIKIYKLRTKYISPRKNIIYIYSITVL